MSRDPRTGRLHPPQPGLPPTYPHTHRMDPPGVRGPPSAYEYPPPHPSHHPPSPPGMYRYASSPYSHGAARPPPYGRSPPDHGYAYEAPQEYDHYGHRIAPPPGRAYAYETVPEHHHYRTIASSGSVDVSSPPRLHVSEMHRAAPPASPHPGPPPPPQYLTAGSSHPREPPPPGYAAYDRYGTPEENYPPPGSYPPSGYAVQSVHGDHAHHHAYRYESTTGHRVPEPQYEVKVESRPEPKAPPPPPKASPPKAHVGPPVGDGAKTNGEIDAILRHEASGVGCTCKRSKCLKLYCMCFGASTMCGHNCRCVSCNNNAENDEARLEAIRTIILRNPSAFDDKFKPGNEKVSAPGAKDQLAHKVGCRCRRSACIKKYCECYHAGVKCSMNCRCTGCQNLPPGMVSEQRVPEIFPRQGMDSSYQRYAARNPLPIEPYHQEGLRRHGEPAIGTVAQNLTFLKSGSPVRPEVKVEARPPPPDLPLVPTLAPPKSSPSSHVRAARPVTSYAASPRSSAPAAQRVSSSEASPGSDGSGSRHTTATESYDKKKPEDDVTNALMMAAVAMTSLHTASPSKPPRPPPQDATPRRNFSTEETPMTSPPSGPQASSRTSQGHVHQDPPAKLAPTRSPTFDGIKYLDAPLQSGVKRNRDGSTVSAYHEDPKGEKTEAGTQTAKQGRPDKNAMISVSARAGLHQMAAAK